MKRLVPIAAILVAAVLVGYLLLRGRNDAVLTGIVATDDVLVSPEIQGRLEKLLVREGDVVQAGQVLATIQAAESQADLSFFESSERQAAAAVSQATADLDYQEKIAISQTRQAEAALAAAAAQIGVAEAEAERAQKAFDRSDALRKSGVDSIQEHDEARIANAAARAHLEALRQQSAAAAAALDASRAGASQVAARRASLQASKDLLAAAQAQKTKAAARLAYAEIRAPMAGIVDVRAARQGEVVSPGQPILTLVNPDDFWIRIDVEESQLGRVQRGDKLTVRLPSGATREGEVYYIAVDADYATQRDVNRSKRDIKTFQVRLRCDNRDRALALGMTAYVALPPAR